MVGGEDLRRGCYLHAQANRAPFGTSGLHGIGDEVQQHLINLARVGVEARPGRGQVGLHLHAWQQGGLQHGQTLPAGFGQIQRFLPEVRLSEVGQHLAA